jgi:regulator of replication initiation timing
MEQQQTELFTIIGELTADLFRSQEEIQRLNFELERLNGKTTKKRAKKPAKKKFDRTLECFDNDAKIRHRYKDDLWECRVDKSSATPILRRNADETYDTVSGFASKHIEVLCSQGIAHRKTQQANGWTDCEVEIDGQWVSCDDIRKQYNQSL